MSGSRYVLVGLSRIAVRVADVLAARGDEVVVVPEPSGGDTAAETLLRHRVRVMEPTPDREEALRAAGVDGADCLLAVSDDDLENLHAALAAGAVAPDVPLVIRSFEPVLVDRLARSVRLRRAYSVSALAAPAFVAAALGEDLLATLRLGEDDISLCRLEVRPGAPIAGATAAEVKADSGCAVVAHDDGSGWRPCAPVERITEGERILIGGPLRLALLLAKRVSPVLGKDRARPAPGLLHRLRDRRAERKALHAGLRANTLLPAAAAVLVGLLLITVIVFAVALHLNPIDAIYFAVSTALGNATLDQNEAWLKAFGIGAMVAGGALLGVVFSYLAALATAERLEEQMGRRARRLSNHVVLAGLGTVGYRIEHLLSDLEIPLAVIERSPDDRFVATVARRTPVVIGDARLPEDLMRVGVEDAACFVACTEDELTNVAACLQAQRQNPGLRTVARVFDEELGGRIQTTLGIDAAVSGTRAATGAFVSAAVDERAPRTLHLGGVAFVAVRFEPTVPLDAGEIDRWRGRGLRVLAFSRGNGPVRAASELDGGLGPGDAAIVAGPEAAVRETLFGAARPGIADRLRP
ncbi:MAG TPA: NAD-binding protein [Actinomycetota bacterium]|nr:NAD-binding protein [Actinomycetota bacterium]